MFQSDFGSSWLGMHLLLGPQTLQIVLGDGKGRGEGQEEDTSKKPIWKEEISSLRPSGLKP